LKKNQIILFSLIFGIPIGYCNYNLYTSIFGNNSNDLMFAIDLIDDIVNNFESIKSAKHHIFLAVLACFFVVFYVLFIPIGFALFVVVSIIIYDFMTRESNYENRL